MNFSNEEEFLGFLSSLDKKNMSEYLSKKFLKWYKNVKNTQEEMPYKMQIINSTVYWSGGINTTSMFYDWETILLSYAKNFLEEEHKKDILDFINEIKIFKKNVKSN